MQNMKSFGRKMPICLSGSITDLGLKSPQDSVFDSRNHLYIADKDNNRIIEYDINTDKVVQIITHPMMKTPTGVTLGG
jgi:hypothetical protein